ncbi:MAG: gliding motility-associated ABC transporter permease subunit GldF [Bacteroidia bacterium]|nr:gliding motility-associated ABC transporter permease subunit GldF [Bacteroidia bacterium]
MLVLFSKEIGNFFSSITGYIVIVVFLLINSLFMWIFPGGFNILDVGYANLDTLFIISPWVFLFLVPAVTMRLFSEEKKTGTMELLLTRPLSDFTIVFAKFLSGLFLVFLSLLPTVIYYLSVYLLGSPVGNLDSGGIMGSYIGLFFLAGIYVSIGLLASSITDNQIVAFILSMIFCFVFYFGFDALSTLPVLKSFDSIIVSLGINDHYRSISRGVIDSRDIIYFISIIAVFLFFSKTVLTRRKWK